MKCTYIFMEGVVCFHINQGKYTTEHILYFLTDLFTHLVLILLVCSQNAINAACTSSSYDILTTNCQIRIKKIFLKYIGSMLHRAYIVK
jgi:hypothetical protein